MPIKTLIVDDEPLARTGLSEYVGRVDFLQEVGQAKDGMEALTFLNAQAVDLVLLDVQMPSLSGIDLVRSLSQPPAVVFTTAHAGFAVDGFELDAIDYLLKPITFPRFLRAMLRVRNRVEPDISSEDKPTLTSEVAMSTPSPADIFIRVEGRVERLLLTDIQYIESVQNYCRIKTQKGTHLPLISLKELLEVLPEDQFMQIHRSYIIQLKSVDAIVGHQVRIGNKLLPVSRPNRKKLEEKLFGNRLL